MTDIDPDVRDLNGNRMDFVSISSNNNNEGEILKPDRKSSLSQPAREQGHEMQVVSASGRRLKNAVEVRDVDLTYGFGIKTNVVLTGMNLTVPGNGIYALIGPSGCGKTSILRCIMGFVTPDAGSVRVFGKEPGSIGSEIPGKSLGYMPQDVALNMNLTVYEMLLYFGRIFLLPGRELEKRIDHLIDVLDIPDKDRFITNLSGGQQRRVSFACAVIHKPKLAILDEPTVGVDPLIREKIWDYLQDMVRDGSTILLTTHYIEETRKADMIGFLRKGFLLAEEPPNKIIHELGVKKLEEAFYQLCLSENERRKKYTKESDGEEEKQFHNYPTLMAAFLWLTQGLQQFRRHKRLDADWMYMLWAISCKFWTQITRDKIILFVWLFLPVIVLCCTCSVIGNLPEVEFGIIDDDQDVVSDAFIRNMDPKYFLIRNYTDPVLARSDVDSNKIFGFIHFYSNLTETFFKYPDIYAHLDEENLFNINVFNFHVDYSNKVILGTTALQLYSMLSKFLHDALRDGGFNPRLFDFPIDYGTPVYGKPIFEKGIDLFDVTNLMIPGCLLYGAFATSMMTGLYFLRLEKMSNMFERTYTAGVSATQLIVAQFIVRTAFNFLSIAMTLLVAIKWYNVQCEGDMVWIWVLLLLQNLAGLSYGIMFTAISVDPIAFLVFATGSTGAFLFFSGIMWPIEAQPYFFRWIAMQTPLAVPSFSLRSIMIRGLPITDPLVYPGFLVSIGFLLLFLVGAANFFNLKKL